MKKKIVAIFLCIVMAINGVMFTACQNVENFYEVLNDTKAIEKLVEIGVIESYDKTKINDELRKKECFDILSKYFLIDAKKLLKGTHNEVAM